ERAPQSRYRDRVPDGLGTQPVHLLPLREGDLPPRRRRQPVRLTPRDRGAEGEVANSELRPSHFSSVTPATEPGSAHQPHVVRLGALASTPGAAAQWIPGQARDGEGGG